MINVNFSVPMPDMHILNDAYYAVPAFPLHVFSERLQTWLTENETATGAPVDYGAGVLLTACAGLIGNSCCVEIHPKWQEPSNIWLALVGSPSSGKTPAEAPILKLLHQLEDRHNNHLDEQLRRYQEALTIAKEAESQWKGSVKKALANSETPPPKPREALYPDKPKRTRLIIQDSTVEQFIAIHSENPRGVIQARDELQGWLTSMSRYKGEKGTDRPFWLECYSGGCYTVDRVRLLDGPIKVNKLGVSVLGGIQPDKMNALIQDADDGLIGRLLYVWPEAGEVVPYVAGADEGMIMEMFRRLYEDLPYLGNQTHAIKLPQAGGNSFLSFRKRMRQGANRYTGHMATIYGKAPGQVARLALVLTLMDWALSGGPVPTEVPYQTQCHAIELMERYFIPMAFRVLDSAGRPAQESYGRILAKWLIDNKTQDFTKRDVYKVHRVPGLSTANKSQAAIEELLDAHWLHPAPKDPMASKGRQAERYLVNPSIYPPG